MPPRKTLTYLESAVLSMHNGEWKLSEIADVLSMNEETATEILRGAVAKAEDGEEVQPQPLWIGQGPR